MMVLLFGLISIHSGSMYLSNNANIALAAFVSFIYKYSVFSESS